MDVESDWFRLKDESMVVTDITHSDGLRVISFSTTANLEILSRASTVFGDGTFKITPWPWYQVFIIHASVGPSSTVPIMYSLLPDKSKRSYDDLFNGLNIALKKRDLELSAEYFMSDFETNIRKSFKEYFPEIMAKGCHFHFSKSIWGRVKKAGLQSYYSVKSNDPKFGPFIRSIFGLPYVKLCDLERSVNNIKKLSNLLITPKCKNFAKEMLTYLNSQWINGHIEPELWNMFMHKGARTNNQCEGYNYKLGAKKILCKHPNVYILASTIRDELIVSQDNAMVNLF